MKFYFLLALFTTATATSIGYDAQDEPSFLRGYEVDWDEDVDVWSTSASCTHNWYVNEFSISCSIAYLLISYSTFFVSISISQCAAAVGGCPACVSNCKCQQGGCSMPACTTNW